MSERDELSDRAIDRLLSGQQPTEPGLIPLTSFVAALREEQAQSLDDALSVRQVAAASEVAHAEAATAVSPAAARPRRVSVRRFRSRAALALLTAALLVALTGVAWAANGSAPGDPLYGLDIALENVSVGAGGASERLQEASVLVSSGSAAQGLDHAASALDGVILQVNGDGESAAMALQEAADRIRADESSAPEGVADLLDHLAGAMADGPVDGQMVSSIAQMIRDTVERPDTPVGPPEGVSPGPPGDVPPGPPGDVPGGPPEGVPPSGP